MESPYNIFLFSPSPKVFDDSIEDFAIFLISFLEILFDLIGV